MATPLQNPNYVTSTLTGASLLEILKKTTFPVKLFRRDTPGCVKITPAQALGIARYGDYEGAGTRERVKFIREIDQRALLPFTKCWLNQEAAVIRFHGQQCSAGVLSHCNEDCA